MRLRSVERGAPPAPPCRVDHAACSQAGSPGGGEVEVEEVGDDYFCMTQERLRRLPFRCYTGKGSDLDQSQQRKR